MTNKKRKIKMTNKKPKRVTRSFLLNLADTIYNPKTKTFLRLCTGTLQNGPDPTNEKRPMHCGLGELLFAVTGLQPEETQLNEDDVVGITLAQSPLANETVKDFETAKAALRKLNMAEGETREAIDNLHAELSSRLSRDKNSSKAYKFMDLLTQIPSINDDDCWHDEYPTDKDFIARSKRVAKQLRLAARILPE